MRFLLLFPRLVKMDGEYRFLIFAVYAHAQVAQNRFFTQGKKTFQLELQHHPFRDFSASNLITLNSFCLLNRGKENSES